MTDDTISRQAAIDTLEHKKDKTAKGDIGGFYNKIIQNDIDALMQLPSAEPQWIPCSERLPEENQICIVTDETMRNTYEYRFCKETYDEDQGWTYLKHRIIAWMPLPQPYKGGNRWLIQ